MYTYKEVDGWTYIGTYFYKNVTRWTNFYHLLKDSISTSELQYHILYTIIDCCFVVAQPEIAVTGNVGKQTRVAPNILAEWGGTIVYWTQPMHPSLPTRTATSSFSSNN